MKPFLGKIFAPAGHGLFFQFQKFQIAEIIFCVVGRIPQNQLIDFRNAVFVTDTVLEEESKRVFFRPAFFMDSDIGQSIETEDDRSVFLLDNGLFFGDRRQLVGHHFCVGGPSLHISAKVQDGADRIRILRKKIGRLVEVARIAFMGQCGEKV